MPHVIPSGPVTESMTTLSIVKVAGLSSASRGDEFLVPFTGTPKFEKQRLFDDQRYPNVVVTKKGFV